MRNETKTKKQLINDLTRMQQQILALERTETEHQQIEETLRESERLYRLLADNVTDVIWVRDMHLQLTYISPSITKQLGFSPDEAMAQRLEEILTPASFDIVTEVLAEELAMETINETDLNRSRTIEVELNHKNGSAIWTEIKMTFLRDPDGQPIGIIGVTRDISERKKAEDQLAIFKRFAEASGQALGMADIDGNITYANPTLTRILGLDNPEDALGSNVRRYYATHDLPKLETKILPTVVEKGYQTVEMPLVSIDGKTTPTIQSIFLIRDEQDKPLCLANVITDITERKHAEEDLRDNEEKYRLIAETAVEGIYRVDESGEFVFVNEAYARILGYERKELLGKHYTVIIPEATIPDAIGIIDSVMAGNPARGEFVLKHKLGHEVPAYFSMGPLTKQGKSVGYSGIIEDITERKQAEKALRESEEKFRTIFMNANDEIVYMDKSGTIIDRNIEGKDILGYRRDEVIGRNISELGSTLPQDQMEIMVRLFNDAMLGTGGRGLTEVELIHKNGNRVFVQASISPFEKDGKTGGILGILRDVTERKLAESALRESEEKYRALVESSNDIIYSANADGMITHMGPQVMRYGLSSEEMTSKNMLEVVIPEDQEKVTLDFQRSVLTGDEFPTQFRIRDKTGNIHWLEDHGKMQYDESGNTTGITGVLRDITERKRTEEQILQRNRELAVLNDIAQTVSQSLHLDETLNNALDKTLEVLAVRHGGIYLEDPEENHLTLNVYRGISNEQGAEVSVIDVREGNVGRVLESREPLFIESLPDSLGAVADGSQNIVVRERLKSVVLMPLQARGKTLGVMFAATEHDRVFTSEERELLITIGHQISTTIENALLYEELERKEELRGEVLQQGILAQEEERKRIARELHDQTSQVLTGASAMIEASIAALPWGTEEVKARLKETRLSLTNMLVDVRNLIYELRPTMLDDLGLVASARWHAEEYLERAGVKAHVETMGRKRKLPTKTETALFRILQESTTNIVKHAKAKNARIKLEFRKDSFILSIEDDGKGFDLRKIIQAGHKKRGMGLLNMRERVEILDGDFTIESQHGDGTKITVSIPTR